MQHRIKCLSTYPHDLCRFYLVKMKHEIYISEESEKTLEMYIDEKAQEVSAESRCLNELRHKKHKSVHDNVLAGVLKKNERW